MMAATFATAAAPELGEGGRLFVLDCPHARTEARLLPGRTVPADSAIALLLAGRHEEAEGCGCAAIVARLHGPGARN